MLDSVRYEPDKMKVDMQTSESSASTDSIGPLPNDCTKNILCSHDGVLLKQAPAEYIADINTSGSLSLVEYSPPRCLRLVWRPNENILISNDQEDWALVDTISKRNRTTSECKAFNIKPSSSNSSDASSMSNSSCGFRPILHTRLDELSMIEVKHRGQIIRFIKSIDGHLHSEFFFQHGNADLFVSSMRKLHLIECSPTSRNGEEYIILSTEKQKLKKTFAELDIGEIKTSSTDSWLTNRVVGFLVNIPDIVQPHRANPKSRPGALGESQLSPESYQMVSTRTGNNSGDSSMLSEDHVSSAEKSPIDSEIENVKEIDEKIINTLPERKPVRRGTPLTETQWREFLTSDGIISDSTRIKEIIFRGGIEAKIRAEVWKYLLNYYQWGFNTNEQNKMKIQKSKEYYTMKAQWLSMTATQEANFSGYRDRKCQIEKDVKRTDRSLEYFAGENNQSLIQLHGILQTYVMYNFDLGYVQGMSDLLAPILAIEMNEVDAFWCFVGFMDMVFANFDMDQAGMKNQFVQMQRLLEFTNPRLFSHLRSNDSENMHFCFRWLLVWFKREFSNDDILKLWECLWTHLPCPNFHLLISIAILDQETDIIIENKYEFNDILKHVNELSCKIDVERTIEIAEEIYVQIKEAEYLPNEIREIIGEPLIEPLNTSDTSEQQDFDDAFDELVRELTPEEKRLQQELMEEAFERSMFMNYH